MRLQPVIVPLSSSASTDPSRFGPKAANLARLGHAGLPIPDGFCLDAEAYRHQVAALGLEAAARGAFATNHPAEARQHALQMKLELLEQPIDPAVLHPLIAAWRDLVARTGALTAVRSSALVEDRYGSSFAGQFESYLGLEGEAEFFTAVRACWAALWSTRALRYMATHGLDPADTAMAVLVQPLVHARAAGGGLSRTADDGMLVNATWGLGSSIAQGEVTPDRFELERDGKLRHVAPGRKDHAVGCGHRRAPATEAVSAALAAEPCLDEAQARRSAGCSSEQRMCSGCPSRSNGRSTRNGSSCCRRARCTCRRRTCPTRSGCSTRGSTVIRRASAGPPAARWSSTASASSGASRRATCW